MTSTTQCGVHGVPRPCRFCVGAGFYALDRCASMGRRKPAPFEKREGCGTPQFALITRQRRLQSCMNFNLSALRLKQVHFIRGRTVHAGYRDIVHSQVHAELAAMVIQVAQAHAAQNGGAGKRKYLLPLVG